MNPPSALHGAMSRDRKPFTYTPGGLDLSEIKSERMAKRLMRNAMNQGVPEVPIQPSQPASNSGAPVALPNFNCLPVQVFPAFNLPANPKSLLRTRSTPDPRDTPVQRIVPPPFINNSRVENNTAFNRNMPIQPQVNNNRPASMYEYSATPVNAYALPRTNYGSNEYITPVLPEISYEAEYCRAQPRTFNETQCEPVPKLELSSQLTDFSQKPDSGTNKDVSLFNDYVPKTETIISNDLLFINKQEKLPKLEIKEEKDTPLETEKTETSIDLTIIPIPEISRSPIQELSTETTPSPIVNKAIEQSTGSENEQTEVKVVKKQVKQENVVQEQNGVKNGDAEAEMTVKLPTKKSAGKTETKVEVVKKILPDGTVEEVKTTTTKTTIDGRTEIKTKTETRTLPKEEAESEEEFEEEEEEEEGEVAVQEVQEEQETEVIEDPKKTVVVETVSKPKENGHDSTVIKSEEKSETTTTKKVVVIQEAPKEKQIVSEEVEEEEIEEEEEEDVVEAEPVTLVLKKPATPEPQPEKPTKEEVEEEEEEEVVEEIEQEEKVEETKKVAEETKQNVEDEEETEEIEEEVAVTKEEVKPPSPKEEVEEEEEEEEEEYEEAEEKTETESKQKNETVEKETKADEKEEVVEKEVEEEKDTVIEQTVETKSSSEETTETRQTVEKPTTQEPEVQTKEDKPEPAPQTEFKIPIREPSVPLEKVEDVEIKPIGSTPVVTKSHTENTEIITSSLDSKSGLSTQTEYNKFENIVTVNRTTKILDHNYENLTQQGIPTVKTYFPPPSIDRISTSPMPARPYQPVYPPEPKTERRHSLLLERLSMERQMPSDIYQYGNQSYDQTQYQGEPQSEVLTVSNVKPSSITNSQWYQQNSTQQNLQQNVIYNNVTTTPSPAGQPWAQPKAQPQPTQQHYQPQSLYQPAPQPQTQYRQPSPQPQPKYQTPPQPQYHAPSQPQYQAPPQQQYQAPPHQQYQAPSQQQYQPSYTEPTSDRTPSNYSTYTPAPWLSNTTENKSNTTQSTQYSYLNKDTTESYQTSTQQYSSSYVPPPWEQDTSYASAVDNSTQNYYQPLPQTNTFDPAPTQGWKPPPAKYNKNTPISYVPPAPNQSFVKPVVEPPRMPGRKTYYSEYERRYISVPESTYIPSETKYQPQPDPSPQYYYDNNEPSESVEPQWRKELREFTEKTTQVQTQTEQTSVQPPWEADPKYVKTPATTYTPTPTWSQTLRPRSWRERSFESEYVGSQEWPKATNTLGRGRPLSTLGKSVDTSIPERARGVSVDRYNPNSYQSPAEHPPVPTHTLTTPAPHAGYHNPNVPGYHSRASAEPREQPSYQPRPTVYREARASPLQSRSFKYLQWITGTEN